MSWWDSNVRASLGYTRGHEEAWAVPILRPRRLLKRKAKSALAKPMTIADVSINPSIFHATLVARYPAIRTIPPGEALGPCC
jgi:hypothetical protein